MTPQQQLQGQISIESQAIINNIRVLTAPKITQPYILTPELIDAICDRIMAGESLTQVCYDPEMPARSTVQRWLKENPSVKTLIDEAYEYWADVIDDINEDILRGGIMSTGNIVRDVELVKHNRWRQSKRNRKQYGDKVELNHTSDQIVINLPFNDPDIVI
ncbi:MAG TPA: hypothetical protein VJM08_03520 [Anaerolineales bacterium]|nr:hypothetical protein [Anaerolineales bacterium]